MAAVRCFVVLAALVGVVAVEDTPIAKVIELLEGLRDEVKKDGRDEAAAYDAFACNCKGETEEKSGEVLKQTDTISAESADIQAKTAVKNDDLSSLNGRKVKQEGLAKEADETNVRCAKEKADYETANADTTKAISSLGGALRKMTDSNDRLQQIQSRGPNNQESPVNSLNLLQSSFTKDLRETLALADVMGMIQLPKHKAIVSMLQSRTSVDPADPAFEYHSDDIVAILESLHKQFQGQKAEQDTNWAAAAKGCKDMKDSLSDQKTKNTDAMGLLKRHISKMESEVGDHRKELLEADEQLKFNELYLGDLTARCEARAQDWDQRAKMRADEIQAFAVALTLLTGKVKSAADEVNVRALLQEVKPKEQATAMAASVPASTRTLQQEVRAQAPKEAKESKAIQKPISFVQRLQTQQRAKAFLAVALSEPMRKEKALALLKSEGKRLESPVLSALAEHTSADPFAKVKGLVQKLVERLVEEATAEATKKGFCDTALGKAKKARDYSHEETQDLSADIGGLEAKKDSLEEELAQLKVSQSKSSESLKNMINERQEDKAANAQTLQTATEGRKSLHEAIVTLKAFYSKASKASSFVQASPVEFTAGFSGSYGGKQSGSNAVMGLLATISTDFDRTIRTTEAAESSAARDFVSSSDEQKELIAGYEEKTTLDQADLKTTNVKINTSVNDLKAAQNLVDNAISEIEALKPACIDSGMSYAKRVQKREDEMGALKNALCMLDGEGVEADCGGGAGGGLM